MPDNEPSWRQNAGGPKKQARKLGWQQEDPKTTGPGAGGTRTVKLFALSALACVAFGGIAYLIYLLWPSDRPGLLAVAADPIAAADRLDHPYDPAGYLSAQRLLGWADTVKDRDLAPRAVSNTPVWADDVDVWAQKVRDADRIDPVVIYFGLHGGTTKSGDPVVFTGRDSTDPSVDKETGGVRVKTILDKLQEYAPKKRKVLVFDNGRGLPDPYRGELYSDFARAVKEKLGGQIAADNTLAVILGAGDGERGWESPDLGLTPVAHRLVTALGGKASPPGYDSFTAEDLHGFLAKEVSDWSKSNRPAGQTPVLFPEPDAWAAERKDQYRKKKFFRDPAYDVAAELTKLAVPAALELPPAAKERWAECQTLAEPPAGVPRPEVYTPAAWRRYRELLLRYETACLLGDANGKATLETALNDTKSRIETGRVLALDTRNLSYPLSAAAGVPSEAWLKTAAEKIEELAAGGGTAETLARAAVVQRPAGTKLPVEAQLIAMVNFFYTDVLKPTGANDTVPDDLARQAAKTRLLAERVALAVRPKATGFAYSERLWPLNRKAVLAGDARRREAEDLCLAAPGGDKDAHRLAREGFLAANAEYRRAEELAAKLQRPLALRDQVLADLPFLANWIVEADLDDADAANARVRTAWADALELADRLDRIALPGTVPAAGDLEALATSAARLDRLYQEILATVRDEVKKWGGDSVWLQGKWQALEHLLMLPVPLASVEQRDLMVKAFRANSANLGKEGSHLSESSKRPAGVKVVRRAKMAVAVLGSGDWGKRNETDPAASKSVLETTISKLTEKDHKLDDTAAAGSAVAANYAKLSRVGDYPKTDAADRVRAEAFARLAVPFDPALLPNPEPGVAARARRWRELLEGLAARAARDHWYDESQQPYSAVVAKAFLADAAKFTGAPSGEDAAAATALLNVETLRLTCEGAGAGETLWTSEASRRLRYGFSRADYPLQGHAVLWWQSNAPDLLSVTNVPRQPVPVSQKLDRTIEVRTGGRVEDAAKTAKPATVSAFGFFRGQKDGLGHAAKFLVNRRPDLVISDARPDEGGMVAVRADKEFDPGAVAILLDFSGSMSDKAKPDGETKVKEMRETLGQILPKIPSGTKLSIRYFVDEGDTPVQKRIFPDEARYGNKLFRDCLEGPDGIFARLEKIKPDGNTPLIPGIELALKDVPEDFRGVKTVIVLTDGADTSQIPDVLKVEYRPFFPGGSSKLEAMNETERNLVRDAVRAKVKLFEKWDASINMVFFGAKQEADLAEKMFEPVEKLPNPGRLYFANDKQDLFKQLDTALRPKVRIRRSAGAVAGLPEGGIPVNRTDDSQITWWNRTETFEAGDYTFSYDKLSQPVGIAPTDRLVARLVKSAKSPRGYGFVREIVFGAVDAGGGRVAGLYENQAIGRVTGNTNWNLAVPEYAYLSTANSTYLVASAALEAKFDTDPSDSGILRQVYPHFVWWDLARQIEGGGAEVRQPGPVFIRPATGLPAPMWQIFADGDGVGEFKGSTNVLRAWAFDRPPPRFGSPVNVKPSTLAADPQSFEVAQDVVVRVSFEPVAFVPDPQVDNRRLSAAPRIPPEQPADPRWCIVVRVEDPQGRTFHARIAGGKESLFPVKEHRYFFRREKDAAAGSPQPVAAKVAGYTVAFGRISENELKGMTDLTLELVNVGELTAERNAANEHLLKLDLKKLVNQKLDCPEAKPSPTGGN